MPDMQTKFVEANGLRFEVLEQGTGVRLALCLHGFPEHAISWRHQIPVLARMGYRVWAVNQRGYGRTTRPTQVADYTLPHLVDDVTALINAASVKSVALTGHDWGAMVAWCFAAEQRRPLERLVIMNGPHPLCFRTALKHWRQMRKSWYVAFFQLPRQPERILTVNGGAIVRRMFDGVALPPDVLAVYTWQITTPEIDLLSALPYPQSDTRLHVGATNCPCNPPDRSAAKTWVARRFLPFLVAALITKS